ncbi:hypothetical protein [Thioalbus denitrificans]|uniref:Uncharacterized protein n=1 Tax=Thioalbus denitrificans TaxID=547122 RepID=A0A369CJ44_9GAMM|nr:hypothetical protein [Thioalbus denitrificans]RCX33308.1 hypothetical protein DFQ59_101609 [Thioalbus denitrificans]
MLLNPAIMALIGVSVVVALLLLLAAGFAIQVMRHWDIHSGSELQLNLERRTYLISTILSYAFVAELVSLLLFVYNAEAMSTQFVGAMCATGVLNVDPWGWPTLFLKIAVFFAGGAWLILNRLDNQGYDYPLVRIKYALLLAIVPLVIAEAVVQTAYFLGLDPDVITSCCGSLFTPESEGVAAEVSSLQPRTAVIALYASGGLALLSGLATLRRRGAALLFAGSGLLAFVVALVAIVSYVALYIYEHPHHHCPFCILKSGHDFVGYYLYIPLFAATVLALGVGVLAPWRRIPSLVQAAAVDIRRFTWLALLGFTLFYVVATYAVVTSNLTMQGVWW